ncbi:MAG: glycosyltransferase family 4 protein [Candidatus Neomarinimicrobiota bacterium]|jgi:glycosyltransferase involved in cell wall biosynthesis
MKILFLTDFFPPEAGAAAARTYEHCKEWVKLGANLTVITGVPNYPLGKAYPGYKNTFRSKEVIDGIKVIRVWTYITENKGIFRRTLDYMSFACSAFIAALFQKYDIVIGTSPNLFTAISARQLRCVKRKPMIMEVRDLWPESIKAVGALKDGPILKYFEWQESRCYKRASKVVCVTEGIRERLIERGVPKDKLVLHTNGVNLKNFQPKEKNIDLLNELGLKDKTIIAYIGTLGMAHRLDFIIKAAKKVQDPAIHFLFVGGGAEKEKLVKLKNDLKLDNVSFIPVIPKKEVSKYIASADIALVNLKKTDLFLGALPSKIFENAAMGKPILLGLKGEAEKVINEYGAGLSFEPENEEDFLEKLEILTNNKDFYNSCVNGCINLAKDYDRCSIAKQMLDTIKIVVEKN